MKDIQFYIEWHVGHEIKWNMILFYVISQDANQYQTSFPDVCVPVNFVPNVMKVRHPGFSRGFGMGRRVVDSPDIPSI